MDKLVAKFTVFGRRFAENFADEDNSQNAGWRGAEDGLNLREEIDMKTILLEIEAVLSNATAELSMPNPNGEKAKMGIEVARKRLLDLVENQSVRDPVLEAKRKLALVYLGMAENQFTVADTEIFSILAKERALQDEIERARKNN